MGKAIALFLTTGGHAKLGNYGNQSVLKEVLANQARLDLMTQADHYELTLDWRGQYEIIAN